MWQLHLSRGAVPCYGACVAGRRLCFARCPSTQLLQAWRPRAERTTASIVMDANAVTESKKVSVAKEPGNGFGQTKLGRCKTGAVEVDGFSIEGVSVGGQETCVMVPAMKVAFDIGRCPERAVAQDFLFITHAHMDHIGGVCMYVASRGMLKMKPPVVIVPACVKPTVEKLFDVYRELDGSELKLQLIGLDIGEEFSMGKSLFVKAFKTYHVVPSQGYIVYSEKNKLKPEYVGLPGEKIKELKASGVQITDTIRVPEVAFTGDTTSDFILDKANADALRAKLLIMESTFLEGSMTIEHAREYGHTHLFEIIALADRLENKSILLIHFSARYKQEEIFKAIEELPPPLHGRVFALTEGFLTQVLYTLLLHFTRARGKWGFFNSEFTDQNLVRSETQLPCIWIMYNLKCIDINLLESQRGLTLLTLAGLHSLPFSINSKYPPMFTRSSFCFQVLVSVLSRLCKSTGQQANFNFSYQNICSAFTS